MPTPRILSQEEKNQVTMGEMAGNVTVGGIIPGTERIKDPLTEGQKRQANFAIRMENALRQIEDLEDSGFNPVNLYDIVVNNLPFVPDAVERLFSSPKYKQYERAKLDFSTAQLRQETGAVIMIVKSSGLTKLTFQSLAMIQKLCWLKDRPVGMLMLI